MTAKAKIILAVPENPHYLAPTAARLFKKLDECVNGNPIRKKGQWQFDALSLLVWMEGSIMILMLRISTGGIL